MIRAVLLLAASVICLPSVGRAQQPRSETPLTSQQKEGRRLFQQRCAVCHTTPTVTSKRYGPALYDTFVKNNEALMRRSIADGFETFMPGFQYTLNQAEINAIVAYLETVPKPAVQPKNQRNRYAID